MIFIAVAATTKNIVDDAEGGGEEMNIKKYICAIMYSLEIPLGVWSGVELDRGNWIMGCTLIGTIMALVIVGVVFFMDGQSEEIIKKLYDEGRNGTDGKRE